ncbi:MAG: chorismate-binding protein, partial [Pseudohongiellaceae bacterium]
MPTQSQHPFTTATGMGIRRSTSVLDYRSAVADLADSLNTQHGVLLASSFEYPGRYTRWDIGFINPPLMLEASGRRLTITALNTRGRILLPELHQALSGCTEIDELEAASEILRIRVTEPVAELNEEFSEEMRSRRPTVFSVLRTLQRALYTAEDAYLGFYGAFGYDLTFQFEDVTRFQQRAPEQRDLVLYFPDQITVADHRAERTLCHSYEFNCRSWDSPRRTETTGGFHRAGTNADYAPALTVAADCDHEPGEFAAQVKRAQGYFRRGDLFEVVPGQTFFEPCKDSPATVFKRLREANPAPYGALMNLGRREYLIAASPEMFVRVEGRQIETCPISGTIERGADAIADAEQIRTLLNSKKDEAELSMCTDVDRNDKARVCEPGSVQVVGRRQIEMYSRLIHT